MLRPIVAAAVAVSLLAACAPSAPEADAGKGQIRADEKEYAIGLSSATVRPGQVTFIARNVGSAPHELVVIKTDLAADKLPIDGDKQRAKEDGKVDSVADIPPGQNRNLRLELPAGHYVVICNIPTHYQLGMRATLDVK